MKGRGIRFIAAGLLLLVVLTALWVWPQKLGRDQIPDVFRIQHTHSFMRLIDKESFFFGSVRHDNIHLCGTGVRGI